MNLISKLLLKYYPGETDYSISQQLNMVPNQVTHMSNKTNANIRLGDLMAISKDKKCKFIIEIDYPDIIIKN